MNMSIKDKAALGRANTKKEQNKIAELLAIAGEGVGRVTPQDIKMKLEIIKGMNKRAPSDRRDLLDYFHHSIIPIFHFPSIHHSLLLPLIR